MSHETRHDNGAIQPVKSDEHEIVVFWLVSDSTCSECNEALGSGRFIRVVNEKAFCLPCADLDHLVYLPRGDTALTRRASKYSTLRAVVLRFSRARKHYGRQGILVEEPAIERAELECFVDTDARARSRARSADRRKLLDKDFMAEFAKRLGELFPSCPAPEREVIAEHACLKHSGRVGRSAAAKLFDPTKLVLATQAHVRHVHTSYDRLFAKGRDRDHARAEVRREVEAVLARWRGTAG